MIYLTIAKYAVVAAFGAMLCLFVYATPRIDSLQARIAQIKQEDAERTAHLIAEAASKQKEYDNEVNKIDQQLVAAQAAANRRAADLSGRVGVLNNSVAAYAKSGSCNPVPQASGASSGDDHAIELGAMVQRCNVLLQRGQQVADSAAIQIRALEESVNVAGMGDQR